MNYKKAFYSKLEDCYLGVRIKDFHKGNIAKSGFSNLLQIKEQYFAHIKAYLESQIESEPLSHDIYNKLFTFFDSYLNESGTPFFSDTPIYKNIYTKVYTNSKDTSLFYKTQNLYYVKSDILYQSLTLSDEQESYEVVFDASQYQQNADNAKNKVLFKLDSVSCNELMNADEEPHNQILIKVINQKDLFPELNNVFKQNSSEFSEDFLKILKQKKLKFNEESLKKIFRSYKKQSEIDFFIHKNAKVFLQEQFDLWMFHYLYQEGTIQEWNPNIIAHLQKIKNIVYEIIKLIADFENELKNIWLKPKFAKKTEYVFSVDTILQYANNANALLESIANDKGFEAQIKEWQELKLIDETFDREDFITSLRGKAEAIYNHAKNRDSIVGTQIVDCHEAEPLAMTDSASTESSNLCHSEPALAGEESQNIKSQEMFRFAQYDKEANCHSEVLRSKAEESKDNKYRYLPIDTKHFTKETKYQILSSFENLESLLNGELIKSDNFQALNTLMPKYQGEVDLIYIDPPYNTGNDGFIYADNFNHASWLSMMNNRLELARELLNLKGSMFISIDDKEQARLKLACDEVFGEENCVSNIIWRKRAGGGNDSKHIATEQEYLSIYAKNIESLITNGVARPSIAQYKKDDKGYYTEKPLNDTALQDSAGLHYDIKLPNGKILNGNEHQWKMSESTFLARLERNEIIFKSNDKVYYKHYIDINSNLIPASIWYDLVLNADATQEIKSLFGDKVFDTPKPEKLLQRILEIASKDSSLVLDFFAGSGTTLAVAQKLGRKWLGVEMGEHFYNVIIPRLKKVIAGFQSGISKECDYKGGGAFCYYELESYEEALSHCEYVLKDSCHSEVLRSKAEESQQGNKRDISTSPQYDKRINCHSEPALVGKESHKLGQHELYKGKDYAKAEAILNYRKSRKLIDRLHKGEIMSLDMSTEYRQDFDIFQTIANLMSWKIKRLFLDSKNIESCEFDNGEILSLDELDLAKYPKLKNLIWW